jgi:hypothetical protein
MYYIITGIDTYGMFLPLERAKTFQDGHYLKGEHKALSTNNSEEYT